MPNTKCKLSHLDEAGHGDDEIAKSSIGCDSPMRGKNTSMGSGKHTLVVAHHKSGTALTLALFRTIEAILGERIWFKFYDPEPRKGERKFDWKVCLEQHSRIHDLLASVPSDTWRGWRCLRHPKGLAFSASLYHLKCNEPWVDVPLDCFDERAFYAFTDGRIYRSIGSKHLSVAEKARIVKEIDPDAIPTCVPRYPEPIFFNGKTYREVISEFDRDYDRLRFEMRAYSYGVVKEMLAFPDSGFFNVSLERLSHDPSMELFKDSLSFIGYDVEECDRIVNACQRHFLWSPDGIEHPKHKTTGVSNHWKGVFDQELNAEFGKLFAGIGEFEERHRRLWLYPSDS